MGIHYHNIIKSKTIKFPKWFLVFYISIFFISQSLHAQYNVKILHSNYDTVSKSFNVIVLTKIVCDSNDISPWLGAEALNYPDSLGPSFSFEKVLDDKLILLKPREAIQLDKHPKYNLKETIPRVDYPMYYFDTLGKEKTTRWKYVFDVPKDAANPVFRVFCQDFKFDNYPDLNKTLRKKEILFDKERKKISYSLSKTYPWAYDSLESVINFHIQKYLTSHDEYPYSEMSLNFENDTLGLTKLGFKLTDKCVYNEFEQYMIRAIYYYKIPLIKKFGKPVKVVADYKILLNQGNIWARNEFSPPRVSPGIKQKEITKFIGKNLALPRLYRVNYKYQSLNGKILEKSTKMRSRKYGLNLEEAMIPTFGVILGLCLYLVLQ